MNATGEGRQGDGFALQLNQGERMSDLKTEQEKFWAGDFGTSYIGRNTGEDLIAANLALFAKVLARTGTVRSVLELGANIGLNLAAIQRLIPAKLAAVEINAQAAAEMQKLGKISVHVGSLLDYAAPEPFDLVLVKTVLIHINPERLADAYARMHAACGRYICIAEYYNPTPVQVPYRGHQDRLFKRDFAGEMLDRYSDLKLVDYGFQYHRGPFPQDDLNWFLLEKTA
jgi:pseudaminic acid biosynthesis-associated methylase